MLKKLRDRLEGNEEGFTLIELLVVVIIIGILAAIAIPTFLNQRENAWRSSVESDLRNAATNMETYYAQQGAYAAVATSGGVATIGSGATAETFNLSDGVTLTGTGDVSNFCINGFHTNLGAAAVAHWNSATGGLADGACP